MPYDKGDFTQQGINGDVSALVRLNEKRVMKVVLSSDDESDNCDISGAVYDMLNGESYSVGSEPTGTITITSNGTGIDVSQYALADINVSNLLSLVQTVDLGHLSTTSGTAVDTGTTLTIDVTTEPYDLYMLVVKPETSPESDGLMITISIVGLGGTNYPTKDSYYSAGFRFTQCRTNATTIRTAIGSGARGIFIPDSGITLVNGVLTIPVMMAYSSSYTKTIDNDYTAYLYGINIANF